jgi:hypothetical protein
VPLPAARRTDPARVQGLAISRHVDHIRTLADPLLLGDPFMLHIYAALAEKERALISLRRRYGPQRPAALAIGQVRFHQDSRMIRPELTNWYRFGDPLPSNT